ncbi:hypothetical protein ACFQ3S_09260 [Mucilaginibacter terrae]|uniref:hypothetical protein n=1 Tax=Mucilaginibacter terrae TaxID=1955052 RepID=UPI00364431EC
MKKEFNNLQNGVTSKNLKDFFNTHSHMENEKKQSRNRVMQSQLLKVTGGKNIVVSNSNR